MDYDSFEYVLPFLFTQFYLTCVEKSYSDGIWIVLENINILIIDSSFDLTQFSKGNSGDIELQINFDHIENQRLLQLLNETIFREIPNTFGNKDGGVPEKLIILKSSIINPEKVHAKAKSKDHLFINRLRLRAHAKFVNNRRIGNHHQPLHQPKLSINDFLIPNIVLINIVPDMLILRVGQSCYVVLKGNCA